MTKLILTRGVPASGKSTFAKNWVAERPDTRARVNRDDLRDTMFPGTKHPYGQVKEEAVTVAQHAMIRHLLSQGFEVIADDTNLRAKTIKAFYPLADEVEVIDFPIDLDEATLRDVERMNRGERFVGTEVITDFYNRFTPKGKFPKVPERADALPQFAPYTPKPGLPSAIIVDIDGTLAHMTDRGPYDTSRYHTDERDTVIPLLTAAWVEFVSAILGRDVTTIIMSGRDEAFRSVTQKWLTDHGILFDEFYMRPEGDLRNDAIVKDELFEKNVAGRYNIDFILDDRTRVVDMWRAKGLKCLQVASGDF